MPRCELRRPPNTRRARFVHRLHLSMHLSKDPAMTTRQESLIDYPSLFPIKVMGAQVDGYVEAVLSVCRQFDPVLDESLVELRPSKAGTYLGVTVTITATSREQLDELYRTLSSHPMVKVVL